MAEESKPDRGNPVTPTISSLISGIKTPVGRLSSARNRELGLPSLSVGPKRFTPKIPQRRVKVKEDATDSAKKAESSESKSQRGDGRRERGRGRGRREYVQTTGALFGEGVAQSATPRPRDSDYVKTVTVTKPTYKPSKAKTKQEVLDDEMTIKNEDECDSSESDDEYADRPTTLPFNAFIKTEIKGEVKQEVKEEIDDKFEIKPKYGDIASKIKKEPDIKDEKKSFAEQDDANDIKKFFLKTLNIDKDSERLLLLQFPTTVPSSDLNESNSELNEPNAKKSGTKDSSKQKELETKQKEVISSNNLRDANESYIGKLQVMKSGAMKLVTGSAVMNVEQSTFFNFMQELILMQKADNSVPEVTALGTVESCLIVYPAFENEISSET